MLLASPSGITGTGETPSHTFLHNLATSEEMIMEVYSESGLEGNLDYGIYRRAVIGAADISASKDEIITIIDYTRPSSEKRLFVINLRNKKLLFHTLVSHGRNSGNLECTHFSNRPGSFQSSPGFYLTAETYSGRNGYSLRLDGMEPGINDQARARAIVIHGADYVSQRFVDDHGYLGRSWGCPALPLDLNKKIIDIIKEGSCLFIHTDNKTYLSQSSLLNFTEATGQVL
ncbi:MAG: murein L,D-transpeptidase catalytic domain family protein [Bacteroidales bacterium]|nr:murein L,D-transpeptidase catalytic domain family protein [Bacteroidales bacterium]